MSAFFQTINAFIEDTCVVVVIAYLLTRGRMLALLTSERLTRTGVWSLGVVFGVVGLTETIFPGARFPYVTHTLIITFASFTIGLQTGLLAAGLVAAGSCVLQGPHTAGGTVLAVFGSAVMGDAIRRVVRDRYRLAGGLAAGMLAQAVGVAFRLLLIRSAPTPQTHDVIRHSLFSIPANGLGIVLLQLVVQDARIRANSERHRLEAEQAHALAAEAQLGALRARVHPHFLFNTLTSIACLCGVDAEKAEAAIIRLGQLMRYALSTDATERVCLGTDIEHVKSYLAIEQERLGERLHVDWRISAACDSLALPPFAVQTLVENAINHGIAQSLVPGTVVITARRYKRYTIIAVQDNGAGMCPETRQRARGSGDGRMHGLQILNQQLVLLYGHRSRVRLFSRVDVGTLAVFGVPLCGTAKG